MRTAACPTSGGTRLRISGGPKPPRRARVRVRREVVAAWVAMEVARGCAGGRRETATGHGGVAAASASGDGVAIATATRHRAEGLGAVTASTSDRGGGMLESCCGCGSGCDVLSRPAAAHAKPEEVEAAAAAQAEAAEAAAAVEAPS